MRKVERHVNGRFLGFLRFMLSLICSAIFYFGSAKEVRSQSLSPNVVASAGKAFTQISFTIGEPLVFTFGNEQNQLTQGFHQTFLEVVGVEETAVDYEVNVYPNPTRFILNVTFPPELNSVDVRLFDAHGRLIHVEQLQANQPIDMSIFARGMYTVVVQHPQLISPKHFSIIHS